MTRTDNEQSGSDYTDCWNCGAAGPNQRREITLPSGESRYPHICEGCWKERYQDTDPDP